MIIEFSGICNIGRCSTNIGEAIWDAGVLEILVDTKFMLYDK